MRITNNCNPNNASQNRNSPDNDSQDTSNKSNPSNPLRVASKGDTRWYQIYDRVPLSDVAYHFASMQNSPFLLEYLTEVLTHCPLGATTLETGIGSGYGAIWLSQRGCRARGIDLAPELVVRARHINSLLGGNASFDCADLFDLYSQYHTHHLPTDHLPTDHLNARNGSTDPQSLNANSPGGFAYQVIHHQGVLEHFSLTQIQAALAQQVALAQWVVFSVPSVFYPFEPEMGDERLLPLSVWEEILKPFNIETLRYYGDPRLGGKEHILCVLRGEPVTKELLTCMEVPDNPYKPGITAIVHTRNEATHITACLETLQGWTNQVIVCDMESEDDTVQLAGQLSDQVVSHPRISNFDRARNVSAFLANHQWVFFLDADERVPSALGTALRQLVHTSPDTREDGFEALLIPFRHHFAGQWLKCLYPGYTAPRLLKNGCFTWGARPHEGPVIDGRTALFPAEDPNLALVHYSFDSLSHYLTKLNRYTDSESTNMHQDGKPFHWQEAIAHFVQDMDIYFQRGAVEKDGIHGFLYAFLSGFYRFEQHAKLYEHRFHAGQLRPEENRVPGSVVELLRYALSVAEQRLLPAQESAVLSGRRPLPPPEPIPIKAMVKGGNGIDNGVHNGVHTSMDNGMDKDIDLDGRARGSCPVVLSGPLHDPSGYGEESRNFLFALAEAEYPVTAQSLPWSFDSARLTEGEREKIAHLSRETVTPSFIQLIQDFPERSLVHRHPAARGVIGRTMFETDRLPPDWVTAINQWDAVWVPSVFNQKTFADAGVAKEKIVVIPGCFDPAPYLERAARRREDKAKQTKADTGGDEQFRFLSVFDWTRHKGWDVLLRAFVEAFDGNPRVELVLKVWSTMGYPAEEIQRQASDFVREVMGANLDALPIRFAQEFLPQSGLLDLYVSADAFVLPSRGEGWGRPFMEAMALGLPTIGTNWSGNTAFMTEENSYLIDAQVVPVPRYGYQEIPTYQGHRWAEPDGKQLVELLRRVVVEKDGEAVERGRIAQEEVTARFNRRVVGKVMQEALAQFAEERASHSISLNAFVDAAPLNAFVDTTLELESDVNTADTETISSDTEVPAVDCLSVTFEGAFFSAHSLAHVNREWCRRLLHEADVEMCLVPVEPRHLAPDQIPDGSLLSERVFATLSEPSRVHIRHYFPPAFLPPDAGQFVLVQPWEYGYLPEEWIHPIQENVTEVWCYSQFVKDVYLRSGVSADKLQVVPLGVDTSIFRPDALPYIFTEERGVKRALDNAEEPAFTFLFVGGTLHRKGIDTLLDAYLQAFSALDNVRLVIKDTGTETVYRGQNARERILPLTEDCTRPQIIYLERDLSAHELASLYNSADCVVQPYRGEGFCLPALEALACGRPVIVPAGGPTDDFVDETVGWRVKTEQMPFGDGRIGQWWCVEHPWMLEMTVSDLALAMRKVAAHPEEARKRGRAGALRVQAGWTWEHSTGVVKERLRGLIMGTHSQVAAVPSTAIKAFGEETAKKGGAIQVEILPAGSPGGLRKVPTISLCMIVKNEERVLGDCLSSIKPFVDEMIVVDTGSTDRTVEIATELGAKVFHFPWCDDFSAARNVSLKHATGDWLLWMDADDTIPEECGKRLHELVLLAEDTVAGFIMQVHIPAGPGEHGFTIVDHVKLFRNRPEFRFEGRIHEQILEAISRTGGQVRRSDLYVVHSGYDYSPEGQAKKRVRDLTILEKDLADRPDHPFVWFNIGMTVYHLKDYERAVPALEKCLSLTKPRESIVRKVYAMLSGSFLERSDIISARIWLERGLSLFPRDPELLFRAGILYRELGDLNAAEQAYIKLLTAREVGHLDSLDVSMVGYKAHHNLALLYQDMGRWQDAEREWQAAVSDNPQFVPSWQGLVEWYLRAGRQQEALAIIARLQETAPEVARSIQQSLGGFGG